MRWVRAIVGVIAVALFVALTWGMGAVARERGIPTWPHADAAIVLGAAVADDGRAGPALTRRARAGARLLAAGRVRAVFTTGGVGRHGRAEGVIAREMIVAQLGDAFAPRVHDEHASRTTWENLVNVRRMVRAIGATNVFVVSDRLHLARALRMARDVGLDAQGVAADAGDPHSTYAGPWHWIREAALLHAYRVARALER